MSVRQSVKAQAPAMVKTLDAERGTFEAIVSVFGNVDRIGDRVIKGAFSKSLKSWAAKGPKRPLPVVFSHQWDDPGSILGPVLAAEEREEGLWIKGQVDLSRDKPRDIFTLMQAGLVAEFSFAYDVMDEKRAKDGANELLELDLIEVGPTLKGMNEETRLLGVKAHGALGRLVDAPEDEAAPATLGSDGTKAGRVLSKANESKIDQAIKQLQEAQETLTQVLSSVRDIESPESELPSELVAIRNQIEQLAS